MKKTLKAKSYKLKAQRGQSLVEAIVGLSVLVVGLLGIITLLSRSLHFNRFISNNYIATYLAAEGVEIIKNMIDANVMRLRPWNCGISDGSYEVAYDYGNPPPSCSASGALVSYSSPGRKLYYNPDKKVYEYGGSGGTGFVREIRITPISDSKGVNEIRVDSFARWAEGGSENSVHVEDHFYNWRF